MVSCLMGDSTALASAIVRCCLKFIVVREFSGEKTMQEAFEQLIERQTCEHFEEWLERKAS